jgi:hypothetical protein
VEESCYAPCPSSGQYRTLSPGDRLQCTPQAISDLVLRVLLALRHNVLGFHSGGGGGSDVIGGPLISAAPDGVRVQAWGRRRSRRAPAR